MSFRALSTRTRSSTSRRTCVGVGAVVLGELGGDAWQVELAVEGEPDGCARAVEVVQVLAVEEHGFTGEQDPVDAVGASWAGGAGGGGLGGVGGWLEAAGRGASMSSLMMTGAASKALP